MQIPLYDLPGETAGHVEMRDDVFAVPFNEAVVHQAMVRQLANRRQGTASTKTRGDVCGSTAKLFRQKGTGRARRGNVKSPLLRGGGVAFGPAPRSYRQSMPKGMRRLALRCLLSLKVREGKIKAVQELTLQKPSTKDLARILAALGVDGSALIVTERSQPTLVKSAGNLPDTRVLPSALLSVVDLLSYDTLIATAPALRNMERIWGREAIENASS